MRKILLMTDLSLNEEDLNNPLMEDGNVWLRLGVENFLLDIPDIGLSLSTLNQGSVMDIDKKSLKLQ